MQAHLLSAAAGNGPVLRLPLPLPAAVAHAQPEHIYRAMAVPNDPMFPAGNRYPGELE